MGVQGRRVKKVLTSEVWAAPVKDGGAGEVVILFNQAAIVETIKIEFDKLGLTGV